MMHWFGPTSWDAPICQISPRCDIPTGVLCERCTRAISDDDQGLVLPGFPHAVTYHRTCFLKTIVGHKLWSLVGLIPDEHDGFIHSNGLFVCPTCGLAYDAATGLWSTVTES